jgi:hypothetical protein
MLAVTPERRNSALASESPISNTSQLMGRTSPPSARRSDSTHTTRGALPVGRAHHQVAWREPDQQYGASDPLGAIMPLP